MYLLTVSLWMPSSLAIRRMDRPLKLGPLHCLPALLWKAIQKARRKGMSLRSIERAMGIHRGIIKQYLDAEGTPTRQSRVVSSTSSSDTIPA